MAEVIWTEPAVADVRRIYEFIADDSPPYAAITADRVMRSVDRLVATNSRFCIGMTEQVVSNYDSDHRTPSGD